jgi:hypothetical protein
VPGTFEHGNASSGSIKGGEFLDQLIRGVIPWRSGTQFHVDRNGRESRYEAIVVAT